MKEKIILGNKVELSYDSIGFGAGTLAISFKACDMAALEKSFRDAGQNNLEVIRRLKEFNELKYPVLLGTSRKSVIGLTLDLPAAERVEGTIVTTVMAVEAGCMFVRVHDVKENHRAIQLAEAILDRK